MTDLLRDRVIVAVGDVYDVAEEIGRGGMAVVYRATDLRLKRPVAIKVLPPDLAFREDVRTRFQHEAETAAQLNHPNIVPIHSVDERGGLVYFVMPLVDGESLAARLLRQPRPPLDDVRRILRDVADALAYAHAHGVVHRDIKPDNILLERLSGRALVTDFGIARAAESDARLTVTGVAVGTPTYMSPEQATGERALDGRSDIYSLGVVGYQMIAGETPFKANNTPAMLMKHLSERPIPLAERRPDVPPNLALAVERALAKKPEDRWPDATAMYAALAPDAREASGRERGPAPRDPEPAARGSAGDAPSSGVPLRADGRPYPSVSVDFHGLPIPRIDIALMSKRERRRLRRAVRRGEVEPAGFTPVSLERRIVLFRRNMISSGSVLTMLTVVNAVTSSHFPWVIFPMVAMGGSLLSQWSQLWAEGVGWRQIFRRGPATAAVAAGAPAPSASSPSLAPPVDDAATLVPPEVLAGTHGNAVRRAASDRAQIVSILQSLAPADRALLPEVQPTVNALVERAASLAQMLHHLDVDVSQLSMAQLDARIASVRAEPEEAADHERRLSLLLRQQSTLKELAARRLAVQGQLESAAIALQNLKLDLLKLRSSGVQAALGDVTSATREARVLSREIGYVLDAAEEVRKL